MRRLGTFKHFKTGSHYEIETAGIHEGTEEPYLSYFNIEHPEQIYFSTVRRFVELVDRGEGLRARFEPITPAARTWWEQMRLSLKVDVEIPKTITSFDEYDVAVLRTGKDLDLDASSKQFVTDFEVFRQMLAAQTDRPQLLEMFELLWKAYHRSAGRPPSPGEAELLYLGLGIAGEAGEVSDYIKKVLGHGHPLDKEKLQKEVGDVLWYSSRIMGVIGRRLRDAAHGNIEKLKARYPAGFDPAKSLKRAEGDT